MGDLAADLLPVTSPLMEYMHNRYLRFYIEQDVVGHMEADVAAAARAWPASRWRSASWT